MIIPSLFFAALILSGCGFQPLYPSKAGQSQRISLMVHANNDLSYISYRFQKYLESWLSTIPFKRENPYQVRINLSNISGPLTYRSDASISRSQEHLRAHVKITDGGVSLDEQSVDAVSSYTQDASEEFTNLRSQETTQERLAKTLAEDVLRQITVTLRNS